MSLRFRPGLRAAVVLGGLVLAYVVLAYGGALTESQVSWLSDVAWAAVSLAAGWRSLLTARRQRTRRQRAAWALFGAAALSWSAGNVYLIARQLLDPSFPPYPTLANYLFLGLAPLFTAGLYQLKPRARAGALAATRRLANLVLIGSTVSLVAVLALLEPLASTASSTEVIAFSILDPAAFTIAGLFGLACLWIFGLDTTYRVGGLLVASIGIHAVVDVVYFSWVLKGRIGEPHLEWTWLVAFALQYVAAVEHEHRERPTSARLGAQTGGGGHLLQAVVPSSLILLGGTSLILFRDILSPRTTVLGVPLIVVFAIALGVREWSTHRREERMRARMARSEAKSRHLLTVSPAIVFSCRVDPTVATTFISPNAESALGLSANDSTLWSDRVHPKDRDAERADFAAARKSGGSQCRYRLLDSHDEYRWVYRKMILVRSGDGKEEELVGSMIDVTDNKRLEDQLFQSQRMEALGHLAGGISHDFNNLLTTILGHSELALLSGSLDEDLRGSVESIQEAGRKAARMTKQLLAFSSRQTLQLEPLDVSEAVREFSRVLLRLIPETIEIELRETPATVVAKSDKGHLEQIVMNLVINASDAMPDGGMITLDIDVAMLDQDLTTGRPLPEATEFAVLSVADTGVGMSPEVRANVFEPFFTTKERDKGTGLGLAIVHGIVRQHGGHIELESTQGIGTTARVYLPASNETVLRRESAGSTGMIRGNERVLIVEDDPAIASLIDGALSSAGYSVDTANSGDEALELLRASAKGFDVVLTDVVMPGLNGRQLVEAMRRERLESRVIYMSGYADDTRLLREISDGSAPLLRKPLRMHDLTQTIRRTLDAVR